MKKIIISLSLVIIASVTFTSCKNDLNVLAPGKEVVSVYGILNPNEPVQNIRINKIFVTTSDATAAAKDQSVINFDANELVVTLERYYTGNTTPQLTTVGNSTKKEIVLTETVVTTVDGAFSNQQRIWQTTDKLYHTGEYKLVIKKTSDLNTVIASAQTVVIDSVSTASSGTMPFYYLPSNPSAYPEHNSGLYPSPINDPADRPKYINYDVFTVNQFIKFKTVPNAKTYEVIMRFHYIDSLTIKSVITNKDSAVPEFVDYNFNSQQSNALTGGELLTTFNFIANDFYTNLGREIAKKATPNVQNRKADYMEYFVYAGTENLYTFLQVNAPSTTIAQDKPYYSNITGGVGIFACRSTSIVSKDLWSNFQDKIACHPSTFPYLFCDYTTGKPRATTCP
jgi:hypothetical protein